MMILDRNGSCNAMTYLIVVFYNNKCEFLPLEIQSCHLWPAQHNKTQFQNIVNHFIFVQAFFHDSQIHFSQIRILRKVWIHEGVLSRITAKIKLTLIGNELQYYTIILWHNKNRKWLQLLTSNQLPCATLQKGISGNIY